MKSGMNQGQVCPFEPKLCQNVATGSRNPLEPLRTLKTTQNQQIGEFQIFLFCSIFGGILGGLEGFQGFLEAVATF